jgi:predicted O-methyltransferase YrrM
MKLSVALDRARRLIWRRVTSRLAEQHTEAALAELARHPHPLASSLSSALSRVRAGQVAANSTWPDKIEHERRGLQRSNQTLSEFSSSDSPRDRGVTVREACRASRRRQDALLLFELVAAVRPKRIVELGTNVGISSAYMAAAQSDYGGTLITLDASPGRSGVARKIHQNLGLNQVEYQVGYFKDTLGDALKQGVDFAFIDGHHDEVATLGYFEQCLQHASEHAVFTFDDIRWSAGMERAWATLQRDPRLGLTVDLCGLGIGVRAVPSQETRYQSPILRV